MSEILDEGMSVKNSPVLPRIKEGSIIASSGDRLIGHLIDLAVFFPVFLVYVFLTDYWFGDVSKAGFIRQPLGLVLYCFFFFILESIYGSTPGKSHTKTHVVTDDGKKPSLKQFAIRNSCRLIPLHSLLILTDDIGWHDKVSKTFVVYRKQKKY